MTVQDSLISQINSQLGSAQDLVDSAQQALNQAQLALRYSWSPPAVNAQIQPTANYSPPSLGNTGNIRNLRTNSISTLGGLLTPEEITQEVWPDVPGISTAGLFEHREPSEAAEFNRLPPEVSTELDIPNAPGLSDIEMPTLIDLQIPLRPAKPILPEFDGQTAVFQGNLPRDLEPVFMRVWRTLRDEMLGEFDSAASNFVRRFFPQHERLHDAVDNHLLNFMEGGDGALPAGYQDTIYRRAQAQIDEQALRLETQIKDDQERAGIYVPPGAMMAALRLARAEAARNQGDAALQAAQQTANLELQFTQFAIGTISTAREQAISAYNQHWRDALQTNDLALTNAKVICDLVLEVQDRWLRLYQLDQNNAELDIRIWETRARYVMMDLELHKQLLEAERLRSQLNQDQIRLVEARIALDERLLRRYSLQLDALGKLIQVREFPIRLYEAEARGYQAYIQGKEANVRIFRALMDGDQSKLEAELARLRAVREQIAGIEARINGQATVNRSKIEYNQNRIDIWKTEVEKALADYRMDEAGQRGDIAKARLILEENQQKLTKAMDKFRAESESDRSRMDAERDILRIQNERTMKHGELLLDQAAKLALVLEQSAEISGNMAASFTAGFTTLLQASSVESIEG